MICIAAFKEHLVIIVQALETLSKWQLQQKPIFKCTLLRQHLNLFSALFLQQSILRYWTCGKCLAVKNYGYVRWSIHIKRITVNVKDRRVTKVVVGQDILAAAEITVHDIGMELQLPRIVRRQQYCSILQHQFSPNFQRSKYLSLTCIL